jgi:hypothetical protein
MDHLKKILVKNRIFLDNLKICENEAAFVKCLTEIALSQKVIPETDIWKNSLSTSAKVDLAKVNLNKLMNGRNNNCFNDNSAPKPD